MNLIIFLSILGKSAYIRPNMMFFFFTETNIYIYLGFYIVNNMLPEITDQSTDTKELVNKMKDQTVFT